ncbi:hypothetical protein [Bradyrhizobium guangdongense]
MWPFPKKQEGNLTKSVPVLDQMTSSIVRLHELGNVGYALVGVSVVVISFSIVAGLASKELLASIVSIVPWIFAFVMTFGFLGVVLLCIERIAGLRLAEAKMRFIMKVTEEAIHASLPKDERIDSLQVIGIFDKILKELWSLETPNRL